LLSPAYLSWHGKLNITSIADMVRDHMNVC